MLFRSEAKRYADTLYTLETGKDAATGLPKENYAEGGAVGMETTPDMSDGGQIIPVKETGMKKGGFVGDADKIADSLTKGGMDKDKALVHAVKMAKAKEAAPKVKPKAVPEGAEEFRKAVEQKFQLGGAAKKVIPLIFERVAPKTRAEIEAIAERMAPQARGEFVRKPGETQSVAGKTQKQYAREKEMKADIIKTGKSEIIKLTPEQDAAMRKAMEGVYKDVATRVGQPLIDEFLKETRDRKSTRLNSSHVSESRMPSSA